MTTAFKFNPFTGSFDIVTTSVDLASSDVTGVLQEANGGTHQSTYTTGDLLYASASNTLSKRAIGSSGDVLSVSSGVPAWVATSASNLNYQISSAVSSQNITSGSATDVTNLSVTITTSGKPVILMLVQSGSGIGVIQLTQAATGVSGSVMFVRGSTTISKQETEISASGSSTTSAQTEVPPSSFQHFDPVAAGTYTYKVQALVNGGSSPAIFFDQIKLVAYELLTPAAIIAPTTTVQAYYIGTPTGTLNGSLNTATVPTKVTDTHNAYSGGTYTVPVAGYYNLSCQLGITGTGTGATIAIFLNGNQITETTLSNINNYIHTGLNIQLALNDTIIIKSSSAQTGPAYIGNSISSWFSIAKV